MSNSFGYDTSRLKSDGDCGNTTVTAGIARDGERFTVIPWEWSRTVRNYHGNIKCCDAHGEP